MNKPPLTIVSTGLVTAVGLSAPATCAAFRAGIANPTATHFTDREGEQILAHQVPLTKPWRGRVKLVKMAAAAIAECLGPITPKLWAATPLILCLAEHDRPGRLDGLDEHLIHEIQNELAIQFSPDSAVIAQGRVSAAIALAQARSLVYGGNAAQVLIAAADSLLTEPTLRAYEHSERLLTGRNSNGFMPGEAGGALLVGPPGDKPEFLCTGIGFGFEQATVSAEMPLRGDGLTQAIKMALGESGYRMHNFDLRMTDLSGEQYYFKEAALALNRVLRERKERFDLWHPAETVGETGSAAAVVCLAVAQAAARKAYLPGARVLLHFSSDDGARAAITGVGHY